MKNSAALKNLKETSRKFTKFPKRPKNSIKRPKKGVEKAYKILKELRKAEKNLRKNISKQIGCNFQST